MTQDERWQLRYNEVKNFILTNKRNLSQYNMEVRNMYTFVKHTRKQMNQGLLNANRFDDFKKLMKLIEDNKHVNQWK